jgi:hypothetical protein
MTIVLVGKALIFGISGFIDSCFRICFGLAVSTNLLGESQQAGDVLIDTRTDCLVFGQ